MLFRERVKFPCVGVGFRVGLADDPHRRLRMNRGLRQFQNPFAGRDGGGADEPRAAFGFRPGQKNLLDAVGDDEDFFQGRAEHVIHQVFFPRCHGDDGIGQMVGFPVEGGGETARREALHGAADEFLQAQL